MSTPRIVFDRAADFHSLAHRARLLFWHDEARFGLQRLGSIGSDSNGKVHRGRDVDLLVERERTPSLFRLVECELDLGNLVGISPER